MKIGSIGRMSHSHSCFSDSHDQRTSAESEEQQQVTCLAEINRKLEQGLELELPDTLWMEWLWQTDPLQECSMDIMLNRMHLLGLIIARYRACMRKQPPHAGSNLLEIFSSSSASANKMMPPVSKQLCLFDNVAVSSYTLRQLTDSLQNIQMKWFRYCIFMLPSAQEAVDALMHRFGVLANANEARENDFDDVGSIEACSTTIHKKRLSKICVRKLTNTFLVLYRHLHCWQAKQSLPSQTRSEIYDCGIKLHHILAGTDDFTKLSMHWDLIPAARLTYVHDFRGLYNCISQVSASFSGFIFSLFHFVFQAWLILLHKKKQMAMHNSTKQLHTTTHKGHHCFIGWWQVVYFHNPDYERRRQERKMVQDVSTGSANIEGVQMIPCIMQLHPDISVELEDTNMFSPFHGNDKSSREMKKGWVWLIMGKVIYLCTPPEDADDPTSRKILFNANVAILLKYYRENCGVADI